MEDTEAIDLLAPVPASRRIESWWLVLRDRTPTPGNRGGGLALITELQTTRLVGRLLSLLRLSLFIDALDYLVAQHRGHLSRFVPDGAGPRRYP